MEFRVVFEEDKAMCDKMVRVEGVEPIGAMSIGVLETKNWK